eukprot:CAMPEP_0119572542 /NCGR_PEP_ID=MMETSP1352-20130426/44673_1 /TAXON_ID=265584 /ORGANISM="Stauroneis constricta, Strain CCMP1120" /LENGTH=372 /DNA_ID=CAMNT_0007622227 /DNA_START=716 /DNA_END=1834 /DNA_ORIENTATION=+
MGAAESRHHGNKFVIIENQKEHDGSSIVKAEIVSSSSPTITKKQEYKNIDNGWFTTQSSIGQKISIALKKNQKAVLYHCDNSTDVSKYHQSIMIIETLSYGKVLVVDDTIRYTQKDEHAYHEMLVHVPLYSHRRPRNVLILGGGGYGGAIIREVCRHANVETITLVEMDPVVVNATKRHLNGGVWLDPRLTVVTDQSAIKYLSSQTSTTASSSSMYDVIIMNEHVMMSETSHDPKKFCQLTHKALSTNGILCSAVGNFWFEEQHITSTIHRYAQQYDMVEFASTSIQTNMGLLLMQKGPMTKSCKTPLRWPTSKVLEELKWYNAELHSSVFVLPNEWKAKVDEYRHRFIDNVDDTDDDEETLRCFMKECIIL